MQATSGQSESHVHSSGEQYESHVQANPVPSNSQCHNVVQANVVQCESGSQVDGSGGVNSQPKWTRKKIYASRVASP